MGSVSMRNSFPSSRVLRRVPNLSQGPFHNRRKATLIKLPEHPQGHRRRTAKLPIACNNLAIEEMETADPVNNQPAIFETTVIEVMEINDHILPFKHMFGNPHGLNGKGRDR
jgi:hypothetical protein